MHELSGPARSAPSAGPRRADAIGVFADAKPASDRFCIRCTQ
ncbi:MAG: hypothetical protein AVDCRST_MAG71-2982 [uncultured Lysobacter sp.]|uniref:Uncharacterized protein n=1 Tax=uncultured Lysobacter sp. TaxID=271060 RepID=A0A6J4MGX3_9GAMM|nr:MAG: hypothetical protein AVDCRST_MAG71-2982 [uncultured Lysobacter sp.]